MLVTNADKAGMFRMMLYSRFKLEFQLQEAQTLLKYGPEEYVKKRGTFEGLRGNVSWILWVQNVE